MAVGIPRRTGLSTNSAAVPAGTTSAPSGGTGGSFLTKYFLVILFCFACLSLLLNSRFLLLVSTELSAVESVLQDSSHSIAKASIARHDEAPLGKPNKLKKVHESKQQLIPNDNVEFNAHTHRIAGLDCERWGGPDADASQEMVYWEDIPKDNKWVSPFHPKNVQGPTQYMTFEPDRGGWNNIRMAMETVLGLALAMGRTLVLPPHQRMYLLGKEDKGQRNQFSFDHFFHMDSIAKEQAGLDIISMNEFLEIALTGRFIDRQSKNPMFPPGNRTDWDGAPDKDMNMLTRWLRNNVSNAVVLWDPEECLAAFPKSSDKADMDSLKVMHERIMDSDGMPPFKKYVGKPNPVNATDEDRLKENSAEREELCLYDERLQAESWVHLPVERKGEMANRMLVHFYAFLYFQDWKHDLWMKRFVRDHVRYIDEIQCAAARIVRAIRQRVRDRRFDTDFDTIHVRRGDFQYTVTRFDAPDIYDMTRKRIPDNTTVFIATDERDKAFFKPLQDHYDVVFLDDFLHELKGVNTNYFGMIDQLVASRGRIFFGCWFSTFTGYINRLRGYHADDHQTSGYEQGIVPSYYYALKDRFLHMQEFYPVKKSFYAREFPTSWRLIDTGLDD